MARCVGRCLHISNELLGFGRRHLECFVVIRVSRKLLIKQLDTSLIQENFVCGRRS